VDNREAVVIGAGMFKQELYKISQVNNRSSEKRPNVVVILADDQGWGDLSTNGNINLNTPHSPMQVPDKWWNKLSDKELKLLNRDPEKEDKQFT